MRACWGVKHVARAQLEWTALQLCASGHLYPQRAKPRHRAFFESGNKLRVSACIAPLFLPSLLLKQTMQGSAQGILGNGQLWAFTSAAAPAVVRLLLATSPCAAPGGLGIHSSQCTHSVPHQQWRPDRKMNHPACSSRGPAAAQEQSKAR